ncbi:MAG: NAD(P)-dependent oxidoreductase [Gallionella sp.]|nr:NAD(P)-dependent oxidoreductase [Gallionella sp.]
MSGEGVSDVTTVVVIGASGFIGEHLLNALAECKDLEIRVLVHRKKTKSYTGVNFIVGDLLKPESLDALLNKNCTVINLAYLAQNNFDAMINLASACVKNQIRRLIHCSTAVVDGKSGSDWVTESTLCIPTSEYEQTKLRMETILLESASGKFEIAILRPTAVFGSGGKNLLKLANELLTENVWLSYIRSCLFNRRSMNLVCVENVVAALVFLVDAENIDREIFIISDDDSPMNNYRDVENRLLASFGKSYSVPRVFFPKIFLGAFLHLAGKSNSNPSKKYSDQKLALFGFKKPQNLEAAINKFAVWCKNTITLKA